LDRSNDSTGYSFFGFIALIKQQPVLLTSAPLEFRHMGNELSSSELRSETSCETVRRSSHDVEAMHEKAFGQLWARLVKGAGVVKMSQNGLFWLQGAKFGINLGKTLSKKVNSLPVGRR
jgi:hypothetical protein